MRKIEESKQFYQQVYSLSMEDMMDIWIETFHPFGVVLVIWDAGNHFKVLQECGVLVSKMNAWNSKVLTVELAKIQDAFELMDNIESSGYKPVMHIYDTGKLVLDNIEP
jgi:predicted enzyme related to lactoylglutathione lyase